MLISDKMERSCARKEANLDVDETIDLVVIIFCDVLELVNELAISNHIVVRRVENRNAFLDNMNDF